jgi:hypothetical protein
MMGVCGGCQGVWKLWLGCGNAAQVRQTVSDICVCDVAGVIKTGMHRMCAENNGSDDINKLHSLAFVCH